MIPDAPHHLQQAPAAPCQARLTLGFADDAGTTRLIERSHFGPLRVQKALYPEGPRICHGIIVHPPGGVVGGDQLAIAAQVGPSAHAFLTTPGAAKWYKANGRVSQQDIDLQVQDGATLEWLPQETIFFDAADVALRQSVALGRESVYIGCDILCFGRTASGESFNTGKLSQRTSIRREGRLIWFEQGSLSGGSAAMHSQLGLQGYTVCATLIACGKALPAESLNAMREDAAMQAGGIGGFGVTQMKSVLVARYLGHASETAKAVMTAVWRHVRPGVTGHAAVVPRIWNT